MGPLCGKFPTLFPYHSHTNPIRIPKDTGIKWESKRILKDMEIVWETYHKGVRLLGVPGNTTDFKQFLGSETIFCINPASRWPTLYFYLFG